MNECVLAWLETQASAVICQIVLWHYANFLWKCNRTKRRKE